MTNIFLLSSTFIAFDTLDILSQGLSIRGFIILGLAWSLIQLFLDAVLSSKSVVTIQDGRVDTLERAVNALQEKMLGMAELQSKDMLSMTSLVKDLNAQVIRLSESCSTLVSTADTQCSALEASVKQIHFLESKVLHLEQLDGKNKSMLQDIANELEASQLQMVPKPVQQQETQTVTAVIHQQETQTATPVIHQQETQTASSSAQHAEVQTKTAEPVNPSRPPTASKLSDTPSIEKMLTKISTSSPIQMLATEESLSMTEQHPLAALLMRNPNLNNIPVYKVTIPVSTLDLSSPVAMAAECSTIITPIHPQKESECIPENADSTKEAADSDSDASIATDTSSDLVWEDDSSQDGDAQSHPRSLSSRSIPYSQQDKVSVQNASGRQKISRPVSPEEDGDSSDNGSNQSPAMYMWTNGSIY